MTQATVVSPPIYSHMESTLVGRTKLCLNDLDHMHKMIAISTHSKHFLTLSILVTPKCVLWQTVKTQMKCRKMRHFIRVYTVYYAKTFVRKRNTFEPRHAISNNVVCVTSIGSDPSAHMRSLIRTFASRLNIL